MLTELPATRYRIAPKARLIFDRARGKHMLIYPERGLELNEAAHEILKLCDGQRSVAKLIDELSARFAAKDASRVAVDVTAFIAQLAQRGVLIGDE